MSKRGRPRTFPGKMDAQTGIRAPGELLNAVYVAAHRRGTDVSTMTREFWQRVVERDRILVSENCHSSKDEGRLLM